MRVVVALFIIAVLPSISCQGIGAVRGLGVLVAVAAGLLAWGAHRGKARAGGGTDGPTSDSADATGATGGSGTTEASGTAEATAATNASGTTATSGGSTGTTATSGGSTGTTDGSATAGDASGTTEFGPCLSIGTGPEMTVCLCACEMGPEGDDMDWAPALLLPVVARRRRRRASVDRFASDGRLPSDVVDRLNRQLDR